MSGGSNLSSVPECGAVPHECGLELSFRILWVPGIPLSYSFYSSFLPSFSSHQVSFSSFPWPERWVNFKVLTICTNFMGASQVTLEVKNPPANAGDTRDSGSILGSGRSPGGGSGNPLQYSCLENPWTVEPAGLWSTGSQRVRHDWSDLAQWRYSRLSWIITNSRKIFEKKNF